MPVDTRASGLAVGAGFDSTGYLTGDTETQAMPHRRRVLTATAAAASLSLAGCLSNDGGGDSQASSSTDAETTGDAASLADHPAAAGLDAQPVLGPDPLSADTTVVVFSDPSCPHCQDFEADVFPKLSANFIEPGSLSYVYRNMAFVAPWATGAVHAFEETYERNADAFWALREWVYSNPDQVADDPGEAIKSYLASETDIEDPDAVRTAAAERTQSAQVSQDETAAKNAGINSTPGFVVAADGVVTTSFTGAKPYDEFVELAGLSE